ncbi:hypothetical protein, partial [Ruegeria lacuscaerulensis]|uniref:hypothetical protein n=1 Tax=Ruegeria lacuscaerulensis TaxID=55218 RepID=UPI001BE48C29
IVPMLTCGFVRSNFSFAIPQAPFCDLGDPWSRGYICAREIFGSQGKIKHILREKPFTTLDFA